MGAFGDLIPSFINVSQHQPETEVLDNCWRRSIQSTMSFIKDVIIPQTNNNLVEQSNNQLTYGEFLCWLVLWILMATMIGPQRNKVWATYPINTLCWVVASDAGGHLPHGLGGHP